ncbi:MAG TPA: FlgD immunoglobulin-like domain containing protein [Thermoanaerobaculia bacterium]
MGEVLNLRYTLSAPATVTVSVYDPDHRLVATLAQNARRPAGENRERWNGKDLDGRVVPDEAYFFVIEAKDAAGSTAIYDPITFSGGEIGDVGQANVDRESGTISYALSQPSRVLLRAGIAGSVLLRTIVDWEPRAAGAVTEYWNGKDQDGLIDVAGRKHAMVLTYFTLPENSVITYGNTKISYREYRASLKAERPAKPKRPMANRRQLSPHFLQSRLTDRSFRVNIQMPAEAQDRVLVRLDVDPKDREVLGDQQLEIMLFVDTVFHAEEERGYLPFTVPIELKQLPPGEHVITANVITYGDQIGVGSRKIRVVR